MFMKLPNLKNKVALQEGITRYGPYGFVGLVILLFYHEIVTLQGAWIVGDHAEQHFPWAYFFAEHLKRGTLPYWTDLMHAGFPLVAEGQIGAFYLPNLLFYFFLPIRIGYAWNIIFHLLASACFTLAYLRSLGIENRSAVFGVLVYLFGSTLGGAYYNITSLKVLTWFPLGLIFVEQILKQDRLQWFKILRLGFVFSLELLAGYLQFAAYAILFTGFYLILRAFDEKVRDFHKLVTALIGMTYAVLVAAVIAFPQLFLTYQLALLSNRASPEEAFAYVGSYSPLAFFCLLFPSLEGFFASKLYLGILPLFFIGASFFLFKRSPRKSLYFLAVLAILLALGQLSPLYVGIVKGFHFYSFRTPVKFVFFAGFFLSVLCALGMGGFLREEQRKKRIVMSRAYALFLILSLTAVCTAFVLFNRFEAELYRIGEWLVAKYIYGQPGHPHTWEAYAAELKAFIPDVERTLDPRGKVIIIPLIKMAAACTVIFLFAFKRIGKTVFYFLSLFLLIADLCWTYSDIRGDFGRYDAYFRKSGVIEYLSMHLGEDRYFIFSENPDQAPLPAGKNMLYPLSVANAYSPFVLKNYYDFFGAMGGVNDSSGYPPLDDQFFAMNLRFLGMMNVKYILSDRVLDFPALEKVFTEGRWSIYQNQLRQPKAQIFSSYEVYSDRGVLFNRLRDVTLDSERVILLEKEPVTYFGENGLAIENVIRFEKDGETHKVLDVHCVENCFAVISQIPYPGWQAWVNGQRANIEPVNVIFTGVPLRKGVHKIVLKYAPWESLPAKIWPVLQRNKGIWAGLRRYLGSSKMPELEEFGLEP